MMLRFLLLGLLLFPSSLLLRGQDLLDFYHIDSSGTTPCVLPHLYFSTNRGVQLAPTSKEDMIYLVSLLEEYPYMVLRMRNDGAFRRFDRQHNRLKRRRLKRLHRTLTRRYKIPSQRLVLVPNEPWDYRSAKEDPANPWSQDEWSAIASGRRPAAKFPKKSLRSRIYQLVIWTPFPRSTLLR